MHLPLGTFLSAFSGLTLDRVEELEDGWEYPKTIALGLHEAVTALCRLRAGAGSAAA